MIPAWLSSTGDRRPLTALLIMASVIVSVWTLIGVYNASQFYRSSLAFGDGARWDEVLPFQLATAMLWAVWTPVIAAIAERLRLSSQLWPRSAVFLLMVIPLLAAARAATGAIVLQLSEGETPTLAFIEHSIAVRLHGYAAVVASIMGVAYFLGLYREHQQRDAAAHALQAAASATKAERLRAELQPSFVFGTLASIRRLVRADPPRADRMLVRLGELLRRRLDRSAGDTSLEEELDYADRWLELHRLRGAGGRSRTFVEPELLDARVPLLAVQSLLEAAAPDLAPRAAELRAARDGDALRLEARVWPAQRAGLDERRARLREHFGEAPVEVSVRGDSVIASVRLPLEVPE